MKNIAVLCLVVLLLCLPCAALANSWGLGGEMLQAVSAVSDWNDYSCIGKQAKTAAVMASRYHYALLTVENGALKDYTTAVYQPENKLAKKAKLAQKGDELTLSYGEEETYTFRMTGEGYKLCSAVVGDLIVTADTAGSYWDLRGVCGGESAVWQREMLLADFNITLFPRSVAEIRHLNLMNAALDSSAAVLGWWGEYGDWGNLLNSPGKDTVPVYSAPFGKSAWRAAKGKAAVGLGGDLWVLHSLTNQDGETYTCIRYDVSNRTQRIGYVRAEELNGNAIGTPVDTMIHVGVTATRDTYLTDDPNVSQFAQFAVPAGTRLTCIGCYGRDYAYVSAEGKNGKIVSGGQIVWGFVPLRDLVMDADSRPVQLTAPERSVRQDLMNEMAGLWNFEAGGSMAHDSLVLEADGTYIGNEGIRNFTVDNRSIRGTWYVVDYNTAGNLYWNDPAYEMVILLEDGRAIVRGLTYEQDTFSLTFWEGGGGYERCQPGETAEEEGENG